MKTCLICGNLTSGSIGAAGIKLNFICPDCRAVEDDLLLKKVERTIRVVKEVEKVLA